MIGALPQTIIPAETLFLEKFFKRPFFLQLRGLIVITKLILCAVLELEGQEQKLSNLYGNSFTL